MDKKTRILELKKEKNAVILAHYYVPDEVQEIADYIGDSFYLSKVAVDLEADMVVFCGVSFMGESAKILNPEKIVIMPDETADCPMAHMAAVDKIKQIRTQYEDLAVVCYINSTAQLKVHADVCVTSANAVKIVKELPNQNIFFIPDGNLGRYVAAQVPEKHFIFNDGFCPIHHQLTVEEVTTARKKYPKAEFLVHPECQSSVLALADYIGSTSGIIEYATASDNKEFIIGTEKGVFYELKKKNPDKIFYPAGGHMICEDMKKITVDKVLKALQDMDYQVNVSDEVFKGANHSLNRMLELGNR